ncbi:hypothetical protein [Micropruina sp.]|uniref:hypothetical protein n=1 Tax=Micropruina sp. TaxID=2737536 RepID=UPI0039E3BE01
MRLIRTRRLEGLSLFAWCSTMAVNISWLAHGLLIGQAPQVVTNVIALCSTVSILVLLTRSLGRPLPLVLAVPVAVATLIIGIDVLLGSLAFGIVAVVPGMFSYVSQGVELVRSPKIRGLSPLFLTLAVLNQSLWLTWAWLVPDPGAIVACSLTLALTTFNLGWHTLRRLGMRAFFVRARDLAGAAATVAPAPTLALTRG